MTPAIPPTRFQASVTPYKQIGKQAANHTCRLISGQTPVQQVGRRDMRRWLPIGLYCQLPRLDARREQGFVVLDDAYPVSRPASSARV
jgi:hypothetical protein